jgi:hypothetical protein
LANWKCVFANRSNSYSMEHTMLFDWLVFSKSVFIWNMFYICFPLMNQNVTSTKFLWNFSPDQLHVGFLSNILTWSLFWRPKIQRKAYWKFPAFNLSTDFCGVLKMHFGELKIRFLPNQPSHMVWFILNVFDCLELSKCVFIFNMIYIRVPLICFQNYQDPNFYQHTWMYSGTSTKIFWLFTWSLFWGLKV